MLWLKDRHPWDQFWLSFLESLATDKHVNFDQFGTNKPGSSYRVVCLERVDYVLIIIPYPSQKQRRIIILKKILKTRIKLNPCAYDLL